MTVPIEVLKHALIITLFVFAMMVLVDYINVMTRGRLSVTVRGGRWRQYFVASSLGATPGCLGAFLSFSLFNFLPSFHVTRLRLIRCQPVIVHAWSEHGLVLIALSEPMRSPVNPIHTLEALLTPTVWVVINKTGRHRIKGSLLTST